jgi:ABC-type dipeptide/oligopeptide/nickel transport system permease subunit
MSTMAEEVSKKTNFLASAWKMHRAKIGFAITLVVVALALVGPFFAPFTATEFVDMPNTVEVLFLAPIFSDKTYGQGFC